jgi:hypothetical protein
MRFLVSTAAALTALTSRSQAQQSQPKRSVAATDYQPWVVTGLWTGSPSKESSYYSISFSISDPNTIYAGDSTLPGYIPDPQAHAFPPSNATCRAQWLYDDPVVGEVFNCTSTTASAHWSFQVLNATADEYVSDLPGNFELQVTLNDSMALANADPSSREAVKTFVATEHFEQNQNLVPNCGVTCEYLLSTDQTSLSQTLVECKGDPDC